MIQELQILAIAILCLIAVNPANGQTMPSSVLVIDVCDVVEYQGDVSDPTRFATSANITPATRVHTFSTNTALGDIVAVNGHPAKGVYIARPLGIGLTTTLTPGRSIADTAHACSNHILSRF